MDPRVVRTRAAVIRAATDLLVEGGPNAVTMDAVVVRSGVAKSTIYRHWLSRDELLRAVIESSAPKLPEPDPSTDVVTALCDTLRAVAASLNDPEWARIMPALVMLKNHEAGMKAIDDRLEHEQNAVLRALIERTVREGVVARDVDVSEAIGTLLGPLLYAHLTETVKIDDALAERTVRRFLAAYGPDRTRPVS
jgi:AcrR family transcriptional regulator